MADNIDVTPGSGKTVRTDDVGGIQVQVVKVALGADGAEDLLLDSGQQTMANSLPVALASDQAAIPITVATVPSHAVTNAGTFAVQVSSALPAGTNLIGKVQPMSALLEGGLTELVGINEQVDQNDYCGSVGVSLGGSYSGEILGVALFATEDGTGAVQDSAGILYVFDADPSISSGDTAISAAARVTTIGKIGFGAADWDTDANGGLAYVCNQPIPFHAVSTLYFAWKHLDATALNDAAGDDEQLEFNFWWRRES